MSFTRYSKTIGNSSKALVAEHGQAFNMGIGGMTAGLVRQAGKQFYDPKDDSLVGAWLMDEGSGLFLRDHSIYGNHGTITGADWVADGLDFVSANSDYINCGDDPSLNISESFTLCAWFKADSLTTTPAIATNWHMPTNQRKFQIALLSDGKINFYTSEDGTAYSSLVTSAGVISTGIWYHVALIYVQSTTMRYIYVDGALSASDVSGYNSLYHGAELDTFIGTSPDDSGGRYFDGIMHSIFIYNRVLTNEEVANLYNAGMYLTHEHMEVDL